MNTVIRFFSLTFLTTAFIYGMHSEPQAEPAQEGRPATAQGPFALENDLSMATWASNHNLKSYEEAKKKIPTEILMAKLKYGKEINKKVPAEVLKDPKSELAYAHYREWARTIFLNPWDIASNGGDWNPNIFYVVTADGNVLQGKLPNAFFNDKDGKVSNQIEFVDPVTKKTIFLNSENELKIKVGSTERINEVLIGQMDAYKGKYTKVAVEPVKPVHIRGMIQDELASDVRSVIFALENKDIKAEAAKGTLEVGRKIPEPSEQLKKALDDLEKKIAE
jgi:hypothetical protein